jgi:pimeloyl-ACP methyl ester carboxylesterase
MDQLEQTSAATVATRVGHLHVETAGSGPPAVLWHSLFVDSTTWNRLRAPLAAERRLILIDGPNHGGSSPVRRPFTLEDCPDAAVEVLDQLGISEPVDWVGNAWGGHAGILFAAAHPDRCRSLVAIGAPIHALTDAERRRVRLLAALYRAAAAAHLRNGALAILPGSGHIGPLLQAAPDVAAMLTAFWRDPRGQEPAGCYDQTRRRGSSPSST